MEKIYLASSSIHKKELLEQACLPCTALANSFEEKAEEKEPKKYAMQIAEGKAVLAAKENNIAEGLVIGLDTICSMDGKIYNKPQNKEEIFANLSAMQNNTSSTITGVCIYNAKTKEKVVTYSETLITLCRMTKEEIEEYIQKEKYAMSSSGGIVIENILARYVSKIEGSYTNILGVPAETIYSALKKMGLN